MKEVGKIELTSIRHIKDWCFKRGCAGGCAIQAMSILFRHPEVDEYMVANAQGECRFDRRCLFDIMVDPKTQKLWAVFIDNVLDEYSDVLRIEVTD